MALYNRQLKLEGWKPVYYHALIDRIWNDFGTSKPNKVINNNFIQSIFCDASLLNNDQIIIVISFFKCESVNWMTFMAGNEITQWFDWDLSTESITMKKYNKLIDEYFVT